MKVCVVGSGGREHALAHVLKRTAEVVVTPGNPGIPFSTAKPIKEIEADLFVIGPEQPLVEGLADELRKQGKLVFGPNADGAKLEGSKSWMKEILIEAGVPTARHGVFTEKEPALDFLQNLSDFYVIKTDGLAAGKGVLVTSDLNEAKNAVSEYLSGQAFGIAGKRIVIEEGLTGPEVSLLAVCDGKTAVPLAPAQDFKRLKDQNEGPNTGGMGAYSPVPFLEENLVERIMDIAVIPTLETLKRKGIDYRGVLYCGLMITPEGPKVLEYNARFGDPETQVVLPRLETDLAELLVGAASGSLNSVPIFSNEAAVAVVCASELYPENPRTGDLIDGLSQVQEMKGIDIFFSGVRKTSDGLVTDGGRVLTVTGMGATLEEARKLTYEAVSQISWTGMQKREDIASNFDL
ncbi:MAG: phosphoribosylamine--glycine ligase [Actinomycetota bacterium]|nr:phosphoribosylamine--glycine ligase [Dehalococcoidia bacterium]MEC7909257.1 phosphoribosylamine--glycine ligase [Actinomycetota bacterium]|tara:strand:- start:1904 stop:3121 length:1218 start_codon:yes stop_codon:yes gene_type:complete